jgi:serine/threonine protein kinase
MTIPKSLCEGRYRVQQKLGGGQHSTVYQCYDADREERVAVKVLSVACPNPDVVRSMYKREVGALEGFEHPHVVPMLRYQPEEEQGRLNIVLELVAGGQTLEDLIGGQGDALPVASSVKWRIEQLLGLLSVIDKAHGRGIIHRDVKLSNILVDREHMRLRLADFGIARLLENYGKGGAGTTLREFYTLPFAAPEQVYGRDTSFPADLHAFGVLTASLLAWRIPEKNFPATEINAFMTPFVESHATASIGIEQVVSLGELLFPEVRPPISAKVVGLVRALLGEDPALRPRLPDIELVLREALDATVERQMVQVFVTPTAREKARALGFQGPALLGDLNEGLRLLYEPEHDDRAWSILCIGRRGRARLAPAAEAPGRLKLVEFVLPHQTEIARRREDGFALPFTLIDGEGSAQVLIDAVWEEHQKRLVAEEERKERESLLSIARFVLEKERERIEMIRVRYRFDDSEDGEVKPSAERALAGTAAAAATRPPSGTMKCAEGEVVTLRVMSVLMGRQSDVGDSEMVEDAIPADLQDGLAWDSSFSYNGKSFATAHGYDADTRTLTLKLTRRMSLPSEGEILCVDVATKTQLDRKDAAISCFLDEKAINPRLASLLLDPKQNTVDDLPPVTLIQPLEPAEAMADLVSRALAARDFFLVQGPPGTGKTTLITELVAQILLREPASRVLVTSQANEAVNNAMDALRALDQNRSTGWRGVRDRRGTDGRNIGFDTAFARWADETKVRSADAEQALDDSIGQERGDAIRLALANWREKLPFIPDAKIAYAASVQLWGMTLLRVPTLGKLLPDVDVSFDYVIVDEAARATPAELLVGLVVGKRFVLVGDHKQLPPFLDNETEDDLRRADLDVERAKQSLFEDLFERVGAANKTTLRVNYRMHRSIGDMIGALYYPDVGLVNGVADEERTLDLTLFGGPSRLFWLDVVDGRDRQIPPSTSWFNYEEVVSIERLLDAFERELRTNGASYTVGVIAAYGDQQDRLRERILPQSQRWKALKEVRIATVDAFQGKQDDIVIYSNVRANTTELRFISDKRRLNVAFSRAKRLLVIVGHKETARQSSQLLRVVDWIPPANIIKTKGGR